MAFVLKDGQQVPLALKVLDAEGNPATVEGAPSWQSSDTSLVTVTPDAADPARAVASTVPGPGVGTATVSATVDADLGEGVMPIGASLDIDVVAADAAVVNLEPGTPEPRAEAPVEPPVEPAPEPAPGEPPAEPAPGEPVP